MSNRTFEAYQAVFRYIENNVFELRPKLFMTDFETSLRKAINTCYQGVRLHGCWFHFDRAIQRYCLQRPKLRRFLKISSNAKEVFKELLSLPLLPEKKFKEGYKAVREKARERRVYYPMIALFRYFDTYWIRQVTISNYYIRQTDGRIENKYLIPIDKLDEPTYLNHLNDPLASARLMTLDYFFNQST